MPLQTILLVALGVATFFNLLGNLKEIKTITFASKPLLVPLIIAFYASAATAVDPLIVLALAFGCAGDVFLLWRRANPKAVVLGLLSFMVGHVFYIASFAVDTGFFSAAQWWFALLALPYVAAAVALYKLLEKDLGKMKGAATAYMGVLLAMSAFALSRLFVASPASALVTWLGSASFIVSDAVLAVEYFKLKREILHHAVVMATYVGAQLLIVVGLLV
ncbi:MAG: lysoplasmalogenase [Candidatus Lokiarchaeota archaeon]|nr:lysoplasmalogenase [Candidatus Lokiarchaeota archaeon]